jgi:hypothetical protein
MTLQHDRQPTGHNYLYRQLDNAIHYWTGLGWSVYPQSARCFPTYAEARLVFRQMRDDAIHAIIRNHRH